MLKIFWNFALDLHVLYMGTVVHLRCLIDMIPILCRSEGLIVEKIAVLTCLPVFVGMLNHQVYLSVCGVRTSKATNTT